MLKLSATATCTLVIVNAHFDYIDTHMTATTFQTTTIIPTESKN